MRMEGWRSSGLIEDRRGEGFTSGLVTLIEETSNPVMSVALDTGAVSDTGLTVLFWIAAAIVVVVKRRMGL